MGGQKSGAAAREPDQELKLTIEHIDLDGLRPDPFNPRRISDDELEALTRSVREFGLVDPIIARREDRTVIGGHQRLVAARGPGLETVPVVFVDLSHEQAKLLNLALNKISGDWDQELLARLLSDLQQAPDIDIALSGFADDEIAKLLKSLDAREKRNRPEAFDLDAALEVARVDPGVQRGDIWRLGDHRGLWCGDSADSGDVSRLHGGVGGSRRRRAAGLSERAQAGKLRGELSPTVQLLNSASSRPSPGLLRFRDCFGPPTAGSNGKQWWAA